MNYDESIKMFKPSNMPEWGYFKAKGDMYAFGYTKEPVDGHYYALKYRISRRKQLWTLIQKLRFKRLELARSRAQFWCNKRKEELAKMGKLQ